MPVRRPPAVVALVLLLAWGGAGCDEWDVDSCTPITLRVEEVGPASVVVSLRSGDRPIRRQSVTAEAKSDGDAVARGEARTDARGEAVVELPAPALDGADEVVASYAGAGGYCPAEAGRAPGG